jgi:ketosteroid isomerase-like protein
MAVAAFMTGCLGSGGGSQPACGGPRAIAATVQQLERATAQRDFATVCDDLLTASARRRAGGPDCVRLTRSAAAGVERASIDLKAIDLAGDTAHVTVVTHATGQAEVSDELVLRRERGRWRIDSLGD